MLCLLAHIHAVLRTTVEHNHGDRLCCCSIIYIYYYEVGSLVFVTAESLGTVGLCDGEDVAINILF